MTITRRSFFGLLGAVPLAVPTVVRAASEPVAAGAGLQTGQVVTNAFCGWQKVVAQIRNEEVAAVALRFDQIMSLCPPRPPRGSDGVP